MEFIPQGQKILVSFNKQTTMAVGGSYWWNLILNDIYLHFQSEMTVTWPKIQQQKINKNNAAAVIDTLLCNDENEFQKTQVPFNK